MSNVVTTPPPDRTDPLEGIEREDAYRALREASNIRGWVKYVYDTYRVGWSVFFDLFGLHFSLKDISALNGEQIMGILEKCAREFLGARDPGLEVSPKTYAHACDLIGRSNRIVILAGAGISVSAGIPDFRSEGGIYEQIKIDFETYKLKDPIEMFRPEIFREEPRIFYRLAKEVLYPKNADGSSRYQPTLTHFFIKELERQGKLLRLYTQNIDTLEARAGIKNTVFVHGSFLTSSCINCGHKVPTSQIGDSLLRGVPKHCDRCEVEYLDSWMRPDIVFMDEALGHDFYNSFVEDREKADLVIVVGTSGKVPPVSFLSSSLPTNRLVPVILINREPIPGQFDFQFLGNCDDVVRDMADRLDWGDFNRHTGHLPATQVAQTELEGVFRVTSVKGKTAAASERAQRPQTAAPSSRSEPPPPAPPKPRQEAVPPPTREEPTPMTGVETSAPPPKGGQKVFRLDVYASPRFTLVAERLKICVPGDLESRIRIVFKGDVYAGYVVRNALPSELVDKYFIPRGRRFTARDLKKWFPKDVMDAYIREDRQDATYDAIAVERIVPDNVLRKYVMTNEHVYTVKELIDRIGEDIVNAYLLKESMGYIDDTGVLGDAAAFIGYGDSGRLFSNFGERRLKWLMDTYGGNVFPLAALRGRNDPANDIGSSFLYNDGKGNTEEINLFEITSLRVSETNGVTELPDAGNLATLTAFFRNLITILEQGKGAGVPKAQSNVAQAPPQQQQQQAQANTQPEKRRITPMLISQLPPKTAPSGQPPAQATPAAPSAATTSLDEDIVAIQMPLSSKPAQPAQPVPPAQPAQPPTVNPPPAQTSGAAPVLKISKYLTVARNVLKESKGKAPENPAQSTDISNLKMSGEDFANMVKFSQQKKDSSAGRGPVTGNGTDIMTILKSDEEREKLRQIQVSLAEEQEEKKQKAKLLAEQEEQERERQRLREEHEKKREELRKQRALLEREAEEERKRQMERQKELELERERERREEQGEEQEQEQGEEQEQEQEQKQGEEQEQAFYFDVYTSGDPIEVTALYAFMAMIPEEYAFEHFTPVYRGDIYNGRDVFKRFGGNTSDYYKYAFHPEKYYSREELCLYFPRPVVEKNIPADEEGEEPIMYSGYDVVNIIPKEVASKSVIISDAAYSLQDLRRIILKEDVDTYIFDGQDASEYGIDETRAPSSTVILIKSAHQNWKKEIANEKAQWLEERYNATNIIYLIVSPADIFPIVRGLPDPNVFVMKCFKDEITEDVTNSRTVTELCELLSHLSPVKPPTPQESEGEEEEEQEEEKEEQEEEKEEEEAGEGSRPASPAFTSMDVDTGLQEPQQPEIIPPAVQEQPPKQKSPSPQPAAAVDTAAAPVNPPPVSNKLRSLFSISALAGPSPSPSSQPQPQIQPQKQKEKTPPPKSAIKHEPEVVVLDSDSEPEVKDEPIELSSSQSQSSDELMSQEESPGEEPARKRRPRPVPVDQVPAVQSVMGYPQYPPPGQMYYPPGAIPYQPSPYYQPGQMPYFPPGQMPYYYQQGQMPYYHPAQAYQNAPVGRPAEGQPPQMGQNPPSSSSSLPPSIGQFLNKPGGPGLNKALLA